MEFASEMLFEAARHNLAIADIPVSYRGRVGRSKLRPLPDGWRHLKLISILRDSSPPIAVDLEDVWSTGEHPSMTLIRPVKKPQWATRPVKSVFSIAVWLSLAERFGSDDTLCATLCWPRIRPVDRLCRGYLGSPTPADKLRTHGRSTPSPFYYLP